jgi:hypothetical protein
LRKDVAHVFAAHSEQLWTVESEHQKTGQQNNNRAEILRLRDVAAINGFLSAFFGCRFSFFAGKQLQVKVAIDKAERSQYSCFSQV